jgi:hypothetical protein
MDLGRGKWWIHAAPTRGLGRASEADSVFKLGADGRIRTGDPLFTKQLLCQLSYVGVRPDYMSASSPGYERPLGGGNRRMRRLQRVDGDQVDRLCIADEGRHEG